MKWNSPGVYILGDLITDGLKQNMSEKTKPLIKSKTGVAGIFGAIVGVIELFQDVAASQELSEMKDGLALTVLGGLALYGRIKADSRIKGVFK